MNQEKEIDMILNESERICNQLNKALFEGLKDKSLSLPVGFYTVARFAAQFLYDTAPSYEKDPVEIFSNAVRNIMQAYEDEGRDETYRILKYHSGNPELEPKN